VACKHARMMGLGIWSDFWHCPLAPCPKTERHSVECSRYVRKVSAPWSREGRDGFDSETTFSSGAAVGSRDRIKTFQIQIDLSLDLCYVLKCTKENR
jgi:hypothetical protein